MSDERPRPVVYSGCYVCGVTMDDVYQGRVIVSPKHVAHFTNGDKTVCGHDATGDEWWWPC